MTLEEAILETLAAKKKVRAFPLPTYVRMRFAKKKMAEPTVRAVMTALKKLVSAGKVEENGETFSLPGALQKKATPRKKATPLPKGRVYFFSPHTDGFERAQKAVKKRFTVKGDSFRRNEGPALRLEKAVRADAVKGARPWQRRWLAQQDVLSVFCVAFDDVDDVLEEINTLIESQVLISKVANAPRFLAWNKTLMSADDDVVKFQFA